MARKLRPALNIVSDIGCLGFDLQHHSDEQIAAAVALLREVNPELFSWLVQALGAPMKRIQNEGKTFARVDSLRLLGGRDLPRPATR